MKQELKFSLQLRLNLWECADVNRMNMLHKASTDIVLAQLHGMTNPTKVAGPSTIDVTTPSPTDGLRLTFQMPPTPTPHLPPPTYTFPSFPSLFFFHHCDMTKTPIKVNFHLHCHVYNFLSFLFLLSPLLTSPLNSPSYSNPTQNTLTLTRAHMGENVTASTTRPH